MQRTLSLVRRVRARRFLAFDRVVFREKSKSLLAQPTDSEEFKRGYQQLCESSEADFDQGTLNKRELCTLAELSFAASDSETYGRALSSLQEAPSGLDSGHLLDLVLLLSRTSEENPQDERLEWIKQSIAPLWDLIALTRFASWPGRVRLLLSKMCNITEQIARASYPDTAAAQCAQQYLSVAVKHRMRASKDSSNELYMDSLLVLWGRLRAFCDEDLSDDLRRLLLHEQREVLTLLGKVNPKPRRHNKSADRFGQLKYVLMTTDTSKHRTAEQRAAYLATLDLDEQ
ncbi:MAG: hypothetical protein MHM6MM_008133 [Cercozoa sp. M6MM]